MTDFVIAPPAGTALPVAGGAARFPVRRVYCIGRNYAAHAVEMGHDPNREPPFFFQKNPDNLDPSGEFPYPGQSADVHHEVELAVALGRGGSDIPLAEAMDHVWGYAVALDMTRRDVQDEAKRLKRPWDTSKAFERSAPIGPLVPKAAFGDPSKGAISLAVNGEIRQSGDLDQMIWKVPEMISYLSGLFELKAGDLIYSGTPAGVGPVQRGDEMLGTIEGIGDIKIKVG